MEHLLLATLGESSGALLSLFDWLNHRSKWPEPRHADGPRPVPPFTEVWVATTRSMKVEEILGPLAEAFPGVRRRILWVGVDDILTEEHHRAMGEILFRLVLEGETWRREHAGRTFSVSLAGGRKSMAALLQQSATFFEVDNIFHVSFAPPQRGLRADTLEQVRAHREWHFVVRLADRATPWRPLLSEPWRRFCRGAELAPPSYPLQEGPTGEPREIRAQSGRSLVEDLQEVASLTHVFAGQALACGVGSRFLRHDLKRVVQFLAADQPEAPALRDYLEGLSRLVDQNYDHTRTHFPLRELNTLCERALVLAIGSFVVGSSTAAEWRAGGQIRLTLTGWSPEEGRIVQGVDGSLLLVALRNLLANAGSHGQSRYWDEPHARLHLEIGTDAVSLSLRNRVPPERLPGLESHALGDGTLPDILRPLFSIGGDGEGLGLFAVQEVARKTQGALCLETPRLERTAEGCDFVVVLRFTRVAVENP